ncbi:hypothetical protein C8C83_0855 [Flavobacterium sp. 90]|uniref:hypothetical protein n=1 Tax=unclassified Flavobacterium TaxID=196869 RepID=UPI000EB3A268|nr:MULTISPECIES: hypothetical protein [unclassified Flavobacterium]RKR09235.1 hypothetical protein C8C82_1154 [Flavobacterium sp. 81]TCK53019.1 hypothetical protein C8C83_0855 [Flavobacterium sp. 90]
MKSKILFVVIFFTIIFLGVITNFYFKSKQEMSKSYNFIITKIDITPTKSLVLYDNNKKIRLWNYDIRDYQDVKVGDVVCKHENSNFLFILRRNNLTGKYEEHLKISPSGIF